MLRIQTVGNGFKPFPTMTELIIKNLTGRSDFNNRIYQKARFGYSPHEPFPSPPAYRQAGGEGKGEGEKVLQEENALTLASACIMEYSKVGKERKV